METIVEKCGICADPPAFVVVYRTPEKLRRKVMPLRNFTSTTDVDWFIQKLKEKHNFDKVPLVKVKKMLR